MPKIGKAIFVSGGMHFAFTLTVGGTTYSFDEKSATSSVTNVYDYSRTKQGNVDEWYLAVYANATLKFSKLKHLVDYCVVGGGGGGGGAECNGSGYYGSSGHHGGSGGGGYYAEEKKKTLSISPTYTITIGSGGSGGIGGSGSGARGGYGDSGNHTSFGNLLTANGGNPGPYGSTGGHGSNAEVKSSRHCFDDNFPIEVSGNSSLETTASRRGAGGGGGDWHMNGENPYAKGGNSGRAGIFVIRSTPKE